MRRLRRLLRFTAYFLTIVVLSVAAGAVVIETDWFKNWLRLKLVRRLAGTLDGELRIGKLSGSLWSGVMLDQLEFVNRDGQVFSAERVRVRYDPITLAHRRWIVERVVIERAN